MLKLGSTLKGYAIEATDGEIGAIDDFLFDDRNWLVRWLVVETGSWLTGRKVLLLPAALGKADHDRRQLPVALTRAQVAASPELSEHEPVSTQLERHLYDYYNWQPILGDGTFGENPIASRFSAPPRSSPRARRDHDKQGRQRPAPAQPRRCLRLSHPGQRRRDRHDRGQSDRRRRLGHSLPRGRHGKLVVGRARADIAECGEGHFMGRP